MAEIGFFEGRISDPELVLTTVDQDRLVIVVAPAHPWARARSMGATRLLEGERVLREPGSGTRSEFEMALVARGIDLEKLRVAIELPSIEAVRAAVEAGIGATAISELAVESALKAGTLVRVGLKLPRRVFHVVRHRHRYHSRAAEAFMAMIAARA